LSALEETTTLRATEADTDLQLTEWVQQNPIPSLIIAAGAGFLLGGGIRSRFGLAIAMLGVRAGLRGAINNLVASTLVSNGNRYRQNRNRAEAGA